MAMDPDRRIALEEERDFLLRSIRDLEAERAAGDIDDADFRTLEADYTARAAEVLRELEVGADDDGETSVDDQLAGTRGDGAAASRASVLRRRVAVIGAVAVVAVVAGVAVMQSSGERGSSALTGMDVAAASSRVDDCRAMEQDGRSDDALDCYSVILESLPSNVAALTFRGWLQVREFEIEDGLEDLDAAIQVDPEATGAHLFRAIAKSRSGDPVGAAADLVSFYENDPAEQERTLAARFAPSVLADLAAFYESDPPADERARADEVAATLVDVALDACIDGDATGRMEVVDVLACYQNALTFDPDNPTASVYLGWLVARSGVDDEAARSLIDDGLRNDPELARGYVFRAALRAHVGDTEGALADLDRFDELAAGDAQVAAAEEVRRAIEAGEDPLPSS
ncbi:MAG: hypothetical protein U5K30_07780 [Acidimicrobiales bacterium]|nr:hypothetical protein [Acidimicrobiales bacterium]